VSAVIQNTNAITRVITGEDVEDPKNLLKWLLNGAGIMPTSISDFWSGFLPSCYLAESQVGFASST